MWFTDFLSGKKQSSEKPQAHPRSDAGERAPRAPGTQIAPHSDLLFQLKEEHQRLIETLGQINKAVAVNDLALAARHLRDFHGGLQEHLLTEDVRLYVYLEHMLARDSDTSKLMRDFRHEMTAVGKTVLSFLDKYKEIDAHESFPGSFGRELDQVGTILGKCIQSEEKLLYPLYRQTVEAQQKAIQPESGNSPERRLS